MQVMEVYNLHGGVLPLILILSSG